MLGIGRHNGNGAGDSVARAAKITGLFALCAAVVSAIPPSINLLSSDKQPPSLTNPATAPTTTTLAKVPDSGLTFGPLKNGKLTVSGSAQRDVVGMYVMIGPKPPGGYDTGCGVVTDGHWQVEVPTDPSWPKYPLMTVPAYGSCAGAGSATGLNFAFQRTATTTTPTPPPGQILDCTKQNGPSCLTGPGFGPPTVYQPNQ
ncbi:hypothetical protein AAHS21_10210 [Mycobacterium sp. 050272]|uniref:hypothetical protein n=1 Tax=Mycobacterium sp. 050272 TaxID=3142488 RepID=UPI00318A6879